MKRIDLETKDSSHSGVKGFFEKAMRRFNTAIHIMMLIPAYFALSLCVAVALVPGVVLFRWVHTWSSSFSELAQNFALGFAVAAGYFLYGFSVIFVAAFMNQMIRGRLKRWRGPYYSLESIRWYLHNGLTYLVRFTFLEFATPTPLGLLFYRLMGMKIGRGTIINTTWISDPSMIELGDKITIGGSVTIVAHYGQSGLLVLSPVKIGNKVTIGLKSSIMGGVSIGDGAKILPHSVLLPNTIVPADETWGGVPAQKIDTRDIKKTAS